MNEQECYVIRVQQQRQYMYTHDHMHIYTCSCYTDYVLCMRYYYYYLCEHTRIGVINKKEIMKEREKIYTKITLKSSHNKLNT